MFRDVVTSEQELRALAGEPSARAVRKQIDTLDAHCRAFIARSPFVLVATADAAGRCDVSPKGDAPGFVRVLGDRRLVIPDRPGNRRFDGMRNLVANPHVGLVFLVPGVGEMLRVNGQGWVTRDAELLGSLAVAGKTPLFAIGVEVEEVFLHCAKASRRAGLWAPERWPDLAGLPSAAQIFVDHMRLENTTVEQLARELEEGYRTRLY